MNELTIGIATANRPERIHACLDSIAQKLTIPREIIVVDSSEDEFHLDKDYTSNMRIIRPGVIVSPSHARKIISDSFNTEYLLYLDDDMAIDSGSVEKLLEFLKNNKHVDIVGGAVNEYGKWRDIGFQFIIGQIGMNNVIEKQRVTYEWLLEMGYNSLRVDLITQPPFLMRKSVFDKVEFDPKYPWAKEIYDFFYSCFNAHVVSYVVPDATFKHYPSSYNSKTYKSNKKVNNKIGLDIFQEKWSLVIRNPSEKTLFRFVVDEIKSRIGRRIRIKKKIRCDGV